MHKLGTMTRAHSGLDDLATTLDALPTEAGSEASAGYELLSTRELVRRMNAEDAGVPDAIAAVADRVSAAIDAVSDRLLRGGRLIYVGAGSSGRIAAVDAAECESTFATRPGQVLALVAGGVAAAPLEQESAEDDRGGGAADLDELDVSADDAVVGISASGRTPYVLGALERAAASGALTVSVTCVPGSELARLTEHDVAVAVGPEFLAGSTRLKAGTAQKLVLNMLTTISMIRLGKTFGNLMVDVQATNEKLRARVLRIVQAATGASPTEAATALEAADGNTRVAIVSLLARVPPAEARALLDASGQSIARAVSP